jgi:hypothetical protein
MGSGPGSGGKTSELEGELSGSKLAMFRPSTLVRYYSFLPGEIPHEEVAKDLIY